jgi:hypothetical protein
LLFVPQRENIERAKEKVMIKAKVKWVYSAQSFDWKLKQANK